jgi:methanogen homoaconitase small subunit
VARVWKFGSHVDTDQIVPGRYAPYMTSEADLDRYAFIESRPDFAEGVRPGDLIVAGKNFGCGSSREYAPEALKAVGVGAIIAQSFARIFFRNALNLGIPTFEADWTDEIQDGESVTLDVESARLLTAHGTYALKPPPAFVRTIWREGSIVEYFRRYRRFPSEE